MCCGGFDNFFIFLHVEEKFRLDRTSFKTTYAKDADDHVTEWKEKTYAERLNGMCYLIGMAYGIDYRATRPDITFFSMRKRE